MSLSPDLTIPSLKASFCAQLNSEIKHPKARISVGSVRRFERDLNKNQGPSALFAGLFAR
jgi:hypothetical protein